MELIFGGMLAFGVLYLILGMVSGLGDSFDVGLDDALDTSGVGSWFGVPSEAAGQVAGIGCNVLAAFMAGAGAVGITGLAAGWSLPIIIGLALIFGWLTARAVVAAFMWLNRQQSSAVYSADSLIGRSARVTINSGAGKTGEVMIEDGQVVKYPAQEIDGRALRRGDVVEIVDTSGRMLRVKKK